MIRMRSFCFLWIAFNAAYANEIHDRQSFSERKVLLGFLGRLVESDSERLIYSIVWSEFPNSIRLLLDNKYIFQPFWNYHNGRIDEAEWQASFKSSKAAARRALGKMNTTKVLAVLLDRLYVLRNQLVHGGFNLEQRCQSKPGARRGRNPSLARADHHSPDDGDAGSALGRSVLSGGGVIGPCLSPDSKRIWLSGRRRTVSTRVS